MSLLSGWQPSAFPLSHFDLRMWLLVIRILQGPASNSFLQLLLLAMLASKMIPELSIQQKCVCGDPLPDLVIIKAFVCVAAVFLRVKAGSCENPVDSISARDLDYEKI